MVYLLDGDIPGGNPKERAVANGFDCLSFGDKPKYKPRKISAVRDFPQGCGRDAQKNLAVVVGEQGSNGHLLKAMENPVRVDSNEKMVAPHFDSAGVTIVGNGGVQVVTQLCTARETNEFRIPADLERQETVDEPVENGILVVEKADGTETSAVSKIQSDEVLGNPVGMQGDILMDVLVGQAVAVVMDGMDNQVEEKVLDAEAVDIMLPKDLERRSFELLKEPNGKEAQALVKQLDNVDSWAVVNHVVEYLKPSSETGHMVDCEVHPKDEAVPSPKDKFRRRRVSATRDFPPCCGRSSVQTLAEEQHLRVTLGKQSLTGIENGGEAVGVGVRDTKGNIEDGDFEGSGGIVSLPNRISSPVGVKEYKEGEVSERKEIVICRPVNRRASSDVFTSEHNEEPVVVNALLATKHCPWRQGKIASSPEHNEEPVVICQPVNRRASSDVFTSEHSEEPGVICQPVNRRASSDVFTSEHNEESVVVNALPAAKHCPWRQGKIASSPDAVKTGGRPNKRKAVGLKRSKAVAKKTTVKIYSSEKPSLQMETASLCEDAHGTPGLPDVKDEEEYGEYGGTPQDFPSGFIDDIEVSLPPYGPNSSRGDARNKVRETLRLFQTICRKLLQGEEAKTRPEAKRIDLEAVKIMKNKGKDVGGKKYVGAVPGVEVGDEFHYRVELAIVGVHRLYQAGIDYTKQNGMLVAISIVSSGAYADDKEDAECLIYCGQGGNIVGKGKEPEDQKLERGNLALRNSITAKNPVRVIHGSKETKISDLADSKSKVVTTYVYDGLYLVENYWQEKGNHGKQVFMFKLRRIPGQPEFAWKEVKKSNKSKVRHGVCVTDIAEGKELIPLCAVNTVDDEKPPAFSYITRMMYADWSHLRPPQGCNCTGRCSDSLRCSCAQKNGGEIPYNRNGAIVEAKPLVYECGPSCKCPPSCYNRVSQHGIKLLLEIFKTDKRGWGVRSLTSIPSGTFICEYVGELLEDKEAERRTNDEYLFDIGKNYSDCSLNPDGQGSSTESIDEVGYTIDAAYYGNVGRFINHSCSPNLYAQNVLYDHDDKRMPHIMLFAAENIPALKELTYHYNYSLDQVHDSDGNIKMKSCYCGSFDCIGRLY